MAEHRETKHEKTERQAEEREARAEAKAEAKAAAEAKTDEPKYKVGDKIKIIGEVVEVIPGQKQADGSLAAMYSIRLLPWKKVETDYTDAAGQPKTRVHYEHPKGATGESGKVLKRDHEADILGCLHENDLE